MMKPNIIVCLFSCLLLSGCVHNNNVETKSTTEIPQKAIVICWFVEDNGAGQSGYMYLNTHRNSPMTPNEPLSPTLEDFIEKLKKWEGGSIYMVPKYPSWVPKGWKVRNLSSNEIDQIGSSLKLTIMKEYD